jgi:hypothetical protein
MIEIISDCSAGLAGSRIDLDLLAEQRLVNFGYAKYTAYEKPGAALPEKALPGTHWGKRNTTTTAPTGRTYATRHWLPDIAPTASNIVGLRLYSTIAHTGVKISISPAQNGGDGVTPITANWQTLTAQTVSATVANLYTFSNVPGAIRTDNKPGCCFDVWVYFPTGGGTCDVLSTTGFQPNSMLGNEIFCAWVAGDAVANPALMAGATVGLGAPVGIDYTRL